MTNAGNAVFDVRRGTFTLTSGTNTADQFLATNGGNSVVTYNARQATVATTTTTITNDAVFTVALGTNCQPWVVSGNLALGAVLNITDAGGFTNGTYPLFTYGGTLTYTGITLGLAPQGYRIAINTNIVGQVNLVASPAPRRSWLSNPLTLSIL